MVKITVIGWYGTETIGDRAIFSGLISLLSEVYKDLEIKLGSLYPTLSHRTLLEDYNFYCLSAQKTNLSITVFDSTNVFELKSAIKWSDLLVMGGGPLMDIREMNMIKYAFKCAKKNHTKTAMLGCGIGPLTQQKYINTALSIVSLSDLTIFRDNKSLFTYHHLRNINTSDCLASIDPALFSAELFKLLYKSNEKENKTVAINLREIDVHYLTKTPTENILSLFVNLLQTITNQHEVLLVPMHTFGIGGDDRYILNRLAKKVSSKNLLVQNIPLSLEETMKVFYNSTFCIGMRFHAVLLQTILSGRNYILDYTNPENGKIINLLNQLDANDFYEYRYYSLVQLNKEIFTPTDDISQYKVDAAQVCGFKDIYIENIKRLLL
jgi:Uncharacterized conserved protein